MLTLAEAEAIGSKAREVLAAAGLDPAQVVYILTNDELDIGMVCYGCGCTEFSACETEDGPCSWVAECWCSACAEEEGETE